jgi:4-hydroxy-3-methylbut-2-enyl diphosphate reductase
MGEAPGSIQLIEDVEDAEHVSVPDPSKVVCLTQTTLSVDDTKEVVESLKRRFPLMHTRNDICYATQNRQTAVKDLAKRVDLILVVGAANSSNSVRLMEVARAQGVKAHRIADVKEVDAAWLDAAKSIGVTSGASTPEVKVTEVVEFLKARGHATAREIQVIEENVTFSLPKELRDYRKK